MVHVKSNPIRAITALVTTVDRSKSLAALQSICEAPTQIMPLCLDISENILIDSKLKTMNVN